jgi:hypothetical protein
MITLLAALSCVSISAHLSTVELYPTDDVWAYPHASDFDTDPYLRVWGFEGVSVAASAADSESFGYSFLKFDTAGLPDGKALKGATLVLTHIPKPAFTVEMAKAHPLEARPVNAGFTEKNWSYGDLPKFMPPASKDSIFGTGFPKAISEDKDFTFEVDLMAGPNPFAKALEAAKGGSIAIALTTTLAPDEETRSVYKFYSKNGAKESRPVLKLVFAD